LPDSHFQRPTKLTSAEVTLRNSLKKMTRVLTPYRAGVTTDGLKHNKYRRRCYGRGACNRRAGGCDIHAAFDSPTGLIYPAMDTGNLTLRTNSIAREILVDNKTGKARGVSFIDSETGRTYDAQAKVVVLAASTLESARLMLLSKSGAHPNGLGNSSGHAKVAAYIDARLAEAWEENDKTTWREGLKLIEQLSRDTNGRSFLQTSLDDRLAILTRIAQNEAKPQKPEELFFAELKGKVVHAYYTSEIGIRQEMEYKGNTYLTEFVGFDVT
jgi:choline dehydrogenase-like flavoprotein